MNTFTKKIFIIIFFILSFSLIVWQRERLSSHVAYIFESPCERTLEYSIGTIDEEFAISEDTFIEKTQEAAGIWNSYQNHPLLSYNPQADLTVSLIYDERQSLRSQIATLEEELDSEKSDYETKKELYDQLVIDFESDLEALNNEIAAWNAKGGAPSQVYQRLTQEREELQQTAAEINSLAQELNISVSEYNTEVTNLQETISDYNQNLSKTPEEGIYSSAEPKIEIYFYVDENEFIHTVAHEFGHALSLTHLEDNENAIMYPYTTNSTTLNEADKNLLEVYCQQRTYEILFNNLKENFMYNINNILNELQ